jgi:ATP-dependent DNA helicase RecQ
VSNTKFNAALQRLEDLDAVRVLDDGRVKPSAKLRRNDQREAVIENAAQTQADQRRFARSRLEMMQGYVRAQNCRRELLLAYFGQAYTPPCDNCDLCCGQQIAPEAVHVAVSPHEDLARPFAIGARVRHKTLGDGQVLHYEEDKVTVLFDESGYTQLSLEVVEKNGLLEEVKPGD